MEDCFRSLSSGTQVQAVTLLEDIVSRLKAVLESGIDGRGVKDSIEKKGNPEFVCAVCGAVFSKKQFYESHVNGHKRNACEVCQMTFSRRRVLVLHMKQEHKLVKAETVYQCQYCSRQFAKKPSLVAHMATHSQSGGKQACPSCGQFFSTRDELISHEEEHERQCKHSCPKCGKSFKRKQQYLMHMQVSTSSHTHPPLMNNKISSTGP